VLNSGFSTRSDHVCYLTGFQFLKGIHDQFCVVQLGLSSAGADQPDTSDSCTVCSFNPHWRIFNDAALLR